MNNMTGTVYFTFTDDSDSEEVAESTYKFQEVVHCCIKGCHVQLVYDVIAVVCYKERKTKVIGRNLIEAYVDSPCDGKKCGRYRDKEEPICWHQAQGSDGNSGSRFICFGNMHFVFNCSEYGTGWDAEQAPTPCDGSCELKEVTFTEEEEIIITWAIDEYRDNNPKAQKGGINR